MKPLAKLSGLLLAFGFVLLLTQTATACWCRDPGSGCEKVGNHDTVFVGTVLSAKDNHPRPAPEPDGSEEVGFGPDKTFTFSVDEGFQGAKSKTIDVVTGNSNCDFWFKLGERYLVYASHGTDGKIYTSKCSGTKSLDRSAEDLTFLRNLPTQPTGTRIYGTVIGYGPADAGYRIQGLSGIPVSLVGPRKYRVVTDATGDFDVSGVRPGTYRISVELPAYYLQEDLSEEIRVNGRGCVQQYFVPDVANSVSGRVIDEKGEVLKDATVSLIPADGKIVGWDDSDWDLDTDENGAFNFAKVPPGRYLLGVNLNESPGRSFPYRSTYYPGVLQRADAQVIEIGLGAKLTNLTLRVFGQLVSHDVTGQVFWPDGRPATNAHIYLGYLDEAGEWQVTGSADADEAGRFTVTGFEGYDYLLQAYFLQSTEGKPDYLDAHAPVTKFRLTENRPGLRLVLSLPGHDCEECGKP